MDHRRKINKIFTPSPLTSKRHRMPCITVTDPPLVEDKPIAEDHRLINWKRWLKIHQRQYQVLQKNGSHREGEDMVMNSCDTIRSQMEMKELMECATIPVPDKYRGNPSFWKMPPFLSNHGNSCSSEIGPVLTKKDLNLRPTLEYVDTPMYIRDEEKNLPNALQKLPPWKRNPYLIKKKLELADAIAVVKPSSPELINLIAVGQGPSGDNEKNVTHPPIISITDTSLGIVDSEFDNRESPVSPGVVVALRINDVEIRRDEQLVNGDSSDETTWTLKFSSKLNEISRKCICFENTGSVAIVYQWRNTSKSISVSSKICANFFFNKNKALILPGQKVEFPVLFRNEKGGVFSESWRMVTDPKICNADIVIRLWGYVESELASSTDVNIETYLDCCIRNTTVREIIEDIIHDVKSREFPVPAYRTLFLEGKLFCAKNPSYFYHPSIVARLHLLYATHSIHDSSPWTLSLIDLRNVLLQIDNFDLRHESLKIFSDLCQQCLQPCLLHEVENSTKKYAGVYNVLCAMANKIEDESDLVKMNCIIRGEDYGNGMNDSQIVNQERSTANNIPDNRVSEDPAVNLTANIEYSSPKLLHTPSKNSSLLTISSHAEISLYLEIFYVRIYNLLADAIEQACAIIDSINNLSYQS